VVRLSEAQKSQLQQQLQRAAMAGDVSECVTLIEDGGDINVGDRCARTPLIWAAWSGQSACVEFLLDHDAEVNSSEKQFGCTALHWAAQQGHTDVVTSLLRGRADPDTPDAMGRSALHYVQDDYEAGRRLSALLLMESISNAQDHNKTVAAVRARLAMAQDAQPEENYSRVCRDVPDRGCFSRGCFGVD